MLVKAIGLVCPDCEEVILIDIQVVVRIADDGRNFLVCAPDDADLWAHVWSHEQSGRTGA